MIVIVASSLSYQAERGAEHEHEIAFAPQPFRLPGFQLPSFSVRAGDTPRVTLGVLAMYRDPSITSKLQKAGA
jgi:hypothetical protein